MLHKEKAKQCRPPPQGGLGQDGENGEIGSRGDLSLRKEHLRLFCFCSACGSRRRTRGKDRGSLQEKKKEHEVGERVHHTLELDVRLKEISLSLAWTEEFTTAYPGL